MAEIYLIVTAVVFVIGSPGYFGLSPQTLFEAGELAEIPPRCYKDERTADDPKGKAATYSQDGQNTCPKDIFRYEERPSIYNFMFKHLPTSAKATALKMKTYADEGRLPKGVTWNVSVDFADAHIKSYAQKLFTTEIKGLAPNISVSQMPADDASNYRVEVRINRVDEPFALTDVNLVMRTPKAPQRWRLL